MRMKKIKLLKKILKAKNCSPFIEFGNALSNKNCDANPHITDQEIIFDFLFFVASN
jgi:hypothetical protein